MKNLILYSLILLSFTFSENKSQSFFTGNANFYYISKLDDGSIINMPYRMLNTSWVNQHNNFELIGTLAVEHQPRTNYSYLMDNPQDFLMDLREFYLTWFTNFGEIRLGKQIQSWGFIEENSPIDTLFDLDTEGLKTMLRRLQVRTGIKCNAHSFRRGFATELRRKGLSELDIAELGRWSRTKMVQRYSRAYTFQDATRYKAIVR